MIRATARLTATAARAVQLSFELEALLRRGAPPADRAAALSRASRDVMQLYRVEVRVSGTVPQGAVLLACNHQSWLDPVIVASVLPIVPLAKKEVASWPVFGPLAKGAGAHFVDRGSRNDGARAVMALAGSLNGGLPVLNYPEGTTSKGPLTKPFRAGSFAAARYAGAAVVPVALCYSHPDIAWTGDDSFVPSLLRFAALPSLTAFLHFGAPIAAPKSADDRQLAQEARAAVDDALAAFARGEIPAAPQAPLRQPA